MEFVDYCEFLRKGVAHAFIKQFTGDKGREAAAQYLKNEKARNNDIKQNEAKKDAKIGIQASETEATNNNNNEEANILSDKLQQDELEKEKEVKEGTITSKTASSIIFTTNTNSNDNLLINKDQNYIINSCKDNDYEESSDIYRINFNHIEFDNSVDFNISKLNLSIASQCSFLDQNNNNISQCPKDDDDNSVKTKYIDTSVRIKEKIDRVSANSYIKAIFQRDPILKKYEYYNVNYYYGKICMPESLVSLEKKWDNVKHIFKSLNKEDKLNFKIEEIDNVVYHRLVKFEIYYYFEHYTTKNLYICKGSNLYSNHLIDLVHQYFRLNGNFDQRCLHESTIVHELRNIYRKFKNKIDDDITFEFFLHPRNNCSNKFNMELPLIEITFETIKNMNETATTFDGKLGVLMNIDNNDRVV